MPLYDYHCDKCELDFHLYRPMKESNLLGDCEKCGKPAKRIFAFPAVKWFFGSCHYDRLNNFSPGNSSAHLENDTGKREYKGTKIEIPRGR